MFWKHRTTSNRIRRLPPCKSFFLALPLAAMLLAAPMVAAANVKLAWNPNMEETLAGYKIHYGMTSRTYSTTMDLNNQTSVTLSSLEAGTTYFFAVTAYDIYGNQSDYSNEVSYTVPNTPPVAQDGTLSTSEDTAASGTLRGTDADAQSLVFSIVTPPSKGNVTLTNSATGAFNYSPAPNSNGVDAFTFKSNDGRADSNVARISINVAPVNDPPTAAADQGTVTQGASVTVNVLANDRDIDGDALTISAVGSPAHGQAAVASNAVRYTPAAAFAGTDSFAYTLSDGHGGVASGTVAVQVLSANKPPVASNLSISARAGGSATGILKASDPDGNPLTYAVVSPASKGKVSVSSPSAGAFTYTAPSGSTGTDSFSFKANDGKADSNVATVAVSINGSGGVVFAVNAGGPQYVDRNGITFAADTGFSGGFKSASSSTIADTLDDTLYQSERFGNFGYTVPLANGFYLVTLKFAETYWSENGSRVFDVLMEGSKVLANLDIHAAAGKLKAYDMRIPVRVIDGALNLDFISDVNNAKLSGLLVERWSSDLAWGLNAGGTRYVDGTGMVYEADMLFSGGFMGATTAQIVGTEDSSLYQTERAGTFSYNIPLPNGVYQVTLKFAEIYWNDPGKRIFQLTAEGLEVVTGLDLLSRAGKNEAYDYPIIVTVNDGVLNLEFTPEVNNAKLSAILIEGV